RHIRGPRCCQRGTRQLTEEPSPNVRPIHRPKHILQVLSEQRVKHSLRLCPRFFKGERGRRGRKFRRPRLAERTNPRSHRHHGSQSRQSIRHMITSLQILASGERKLTCPQACHPRTPPPSRRLPA